ncbi:hypothetical protein ABT282_07760 [Streptomyces sp. NPDC000927]|uniref:hypothetical protein n=1 Tax=Streptomyces sp. NPDC000927 TaxID=3154371 RepID=UPI00332C3C6D
MDVAAMAHSPSGLKPPHGVTITQHPGGGWNTLIQWDYDFRYEEIQRFVISRKKRGEVHWELVTDDIDNSERSYVDTLPDESHYTYCVAAVPNDGGQPMKAFPEVPIGSIGTRGEPAYVTASPDTAVPTNIHKPIRSLSGAMYVTWDIQPQATAYLLQAINKDGDPYMEVTVTNPDTPIGLLVGPHPEPVVFAKVSVLRSRPDGILYPAASATQRLERDDVRQPHLGVVEFRYDTDTGFTHGAVLALSESDCHLPPLRVNGVEQMSPWSPLGRFGAAAMILYLTQGRQGVSATMPTLPVSSIDQP